VAALILGTGAVTVARLDSWHEQLGLLLSSSLLELSVLSCALALWTAVEMVGRRRGILRPQLWPTPVDHGALHVAHAAVVAAIVSTSAMAVLPLYVSLRLSGGAHLLAALTTGLGLFGLGCALGALFGALGQRLRALGTIASLWLTVGFLFVEIWWYRSTLTALDSRRAALLEFVHTGPVPALASAAVVALVIAVRSGTAAEVFPTDSIVGTRRIRVRRRRYHHSIATIQRIRLLRSTGFASAWLSAAGICSAAWFGMRQGWIDLSGGSETVLLIGVAQAFALTASRLRLLDKSVEPTLVAMGTSWNSYAFRSLQPVWLLTCPAAAVAAVPLALAVREPGVALDSALVSVAAATLGWTVAGFHNADIATGSQETYLSLGTFILLAALLSISSSVTTASHAVVASTLAASVAVVGLGVEYQTRRWRNSIVSL